MLLEKQTNRNGGKRYDYSGANPWGGFSLDEERGIAYISTGNAGRYFNGVNRPGKNRHANSIVALDIKNKKIVDEERAFTFKKLYEHNWKESPKKNFLW